MITHHSDNKGTNIFQYLEVSFTFSLVSRFLSENISYSPTQTHEKTFSSPPQSGSFDVKLESRRNYNSIDTEFLTFYSFKPLSAYASNLLLLN